MHKKMTEHLVYDVRKESTLRGRTAVLHDSFVGETAYIFSCGPSLNDIWCPQLAHHLTSGDRFTACVRGSYNKPGMEIAADMYLFNPIRIPEIRRGFNPHMLRVASTHMWHDDTLKMLCHGFDIFYPIAGCPLDKSLMATGNFHRAEFPESGPIVPRPWGPGVLLDVGLFLIMHMGFKRIIVVGWDMGETSYTHFDNKKNIINEEGIADEVKMAKSSMKKLVSWMGAKGVRLELCSPQSVLPIPQITYDELLGA